MLVRKTGPKCFFKVWGSSRDCTVLTCCCKYSKTSGVITLKFSTKVSMAATPLGPALFCFSCADSAVVEMKKMSGLDSLNAR